jgi:hypothetical protein
MPRLNVSLFDGRPLLDIASYARHGSGRRDRLSPAEIAQIARTVGRVPEVVVKVLSRNSTTTASVGKHIDYIVRKGELELETDGGERLGGRGIGRHLLEDWDLDLDEHRRHAELPPALGRDPPKLVHKLMFSMPPGTPPVAVLAAARVFLREEFALKHRYAFVLHTDEPHPHVHAVVKAVSEQGVRLNIRKATLREWRAKFARHLRAQGIEANATERGVRGVTQKAKKDGIYRARQRGESTYYRTRGEEVADALVRGGTPVEDGRRTLIETRKAVVRGWLTVADLAATSGESDLAKTVRRFVDELPSPLTEREWFTGQLQGHMPTRIHARERDTFRR